MCAPGWDVITMSLRCPQLYRWTMVVESRYIEKCPHYFDVRLKQGLFEGCSAAILCSPEGHLCSPEGHLCSPEQKNVQLLFLKIVTRLRMGMVKGAKKSV